MLRKITVHGFKSFPDRTELQLGPGITAIVGPNGCGKSNLADALRWVLGEQNPRVLRSWRLGDVIFSGTETRRAMGQAEVRLLLEGAGDGAETEVVRRLARDGSSEYRLNGRQCRLKDVVDMFSGTGLSHTGYVVIGQGAIHDLASGKPEDRRVWIEEASGVAKVRLDKRETEGKLERARASIVRLDDLLLDLAARKTVLEEDRKLAGEYRRLTAQRRTMELATWLYQAEEESKKLVSLGRKLLKTQEDLQRGRETLPVLEQEFADLIAEREKQAFVRRQAMSERQDAASKLLELEKRREQARSQTGLLRREIDARVVRKGVIEKDLARIGQEEKTLKAALVEVQAQDRELAEKLDQARAERARSEALWKELSGKVIGARAEIAALTGELSSWQRKRDEVSRKLDGTQEQISLCRGNLITAQKDKGLKTRELAAIVDEISRREDDVRKTRHAAASVGEKAASLRASHQRATLKEKDFERTVSALSARKKLLEEMERKFEGYSRGPRTILEAAAQGRLNGVLGPVSGLLGASEEYIPALSAAIGGAAENIVVQTEEDAKQSIEYLKKVRGGRVTFLPLPLLRRRSMHGRAVGAMTSLKGVRALSEVVSCPKSLEPLVRYLLGNVVLADTIEVGLEFMKASGWVARVVTLAGEIIDPGGAMTGGEAPRHEVLFRRKQELAALGLDLGRASSELEEIRAQCNNLAQESAEALLQVAAAKERLTEQMGALDKALAKKQTLESDLESLEALMARTTRETDLLQENVKGLAEERDYLVNREKEIAGSIGSLQERLRDHEAAMDEIGKDDEDALSVLRNLSGHKEKTERQLFALTRRFESLSGERVTLERSLEEENKEILRQSGLLEQAQAQDREYSVKILDLDGQVKTLVGELVEVERREAHISETMAKLKENMERLDTEKGRLEGRIHETQEEIASLQKSFQDTCNLLSTQFGIGNFQEYEGPRMPRASGLAAIEELDMALSRMGSVNLRAEDDCKEVSDRIGFLTVEKEDVERAIEELLKAQVLVEKEIERRFITTFQKVAASFERVFSDLFGGGTGQLILAEETLGVEVEAQPPGRKHKHINLLSGGERALCGLALIFSVLSVRPSPLIVLDEADTSLDEANVVRFSRFLKRYSRETQFLVITHQKATMEVADLLYGVTMEEPGVSKVFSMRLDQSQNAAHRAP